MLKSRNNSHRQKQGGYSLLMVIFMVATMLIFASVATQSILTQGRREREKEMAWRGEQYRRAIGMYFRKFGKYPTKVEDLVKQTNGVRFLRQAYTDPMNKEDGSWRFIYVGPNGQLVGSLRHTSLLQGLISTPTLPGGIGGTMGQAGQTGQPGQLTNSALAPNPLASQPQPLEGAVIGGNIIGVASKVKQSSLRVYQGGDTYELWEFIWNPQGQIAIPGQGLPGPGAPVGAPGVVSPNQPAPGTPPATGTPPVDPQGGTPQLPNPTGQ